MKKVFETYGDAIMVVVVLLALGAIITLALAKGGYIDTEFQSMFEGFFDNMKSVSGLA